MECNFSFRTTLTFQEWRDPFWVMLHDQDTLMRTMDGHRGEDCSLSLTERRNSGVIHSNQIASTYSFTLTFLPFPLTSIESAKFLPVSHWWSTKAVLVLYFKGKVFNLFCIILRIPLKYLHYETTPEGRWCALKYRSRTIQSAAPLPLVGG